MFQMICFRYQRYFMKIPMSFGKILPFTRYSTRDTTVRMASTCKLQLVRGSQQFFTHGRLKHWLSFFVENNESSSASANIFPSSIDRQTTNISVLFSECYCFGSNKFVLLFSCNFSRLKFPR